MQYEGVHIHSPMNSLPNLLPIINISEETPSVRTFTFEYTLHARPGQFVMLWIPGVDQKPFSVGGDTGSTFSLTIFNYGPLTAALFERTPGDRVGISGPYGTAYSWQPHSHVITVAGGYGAAPLGFLAEQAATQGCSIDFCTGARSASAVLFEERAKRIGATVHVSTDDGSKGHAGYVTDILSKLLQYKKSDTKIFACGPERMEKKVADICRDEGMPCEVSVERYMKCGFGICGQCCVDDTGERMCIEGPVVSGEKALSFSEFGVYHRDKAGRKQMCK